MLKYGTNSSLARPSRAGCKVISAFVSTAGYRAKTVEHKLCAVRSLLRFAAGEGLVDRPDFRRS
jgi:hypothetical protein